MTLLKRYLPHILVVIGFIIASLAYFNPVLSGKILYQNDIKLYESMARQQIEFRKNTGEETYWNNSAYGGMPTYALGARFEHDYMDKLDRALRFLPRPADYLFLYFLSFYILMLAMKIPWKYAVIGALAFGFSTYLIIIIGVGHNSKAHAIAYFPLVLSGIILVFRKRYLWGGLLTAVAMGLEVQANHYQMTYYLGLLVGVLGLAYLIDAYRKNKLKHFGISVGIMVLAVILGIASNANTLMTTAEYADTSIRGKNYLVDETQNSSKSSDGLDYEYITQYSYGIQESLNLFVPKLMGVGRSSDLGKDSAFYQKLLSLGYPAEQANYFAQGTGLYWGNQPFVEAPPYLGVTVVFLALLGLLLIKGRLRWWLIGGMVLSLTLSWGKNLDFLTQFFVEYVPLYNKFRAVSSIQVILELLIPIAAVLGIYRFFENKFEKEHLQKKFLISVGILGGICLIFWLFGGSIFSFKSPNDVQLAIEQPDIFDAIKEDRITIMKSDALRSLIFILLVSGALFFAFKKKISNNVALPLIALLITVDLVGVDRRSVDEESFISKRSYDANFLPTDVDKEILKDKSYYRVLDLARGFNNSHTNYFFNTVGGYSAVRPRKMEDIFFGYIAKGDLNVINMLNIKYVIQNDEQKGLSVQENKYALGPAWFVEDLIFVEDYKDEFEGLKKLDVKNKAVVRDEFKNEIGQSNFQRDSLANVSITKTDPNHLEYKVKTSNPGFLVFSETYYMNGWKAYIDGEQQQIYPVNYMLRGLKVPAGNHTITFKFEPMIVQTAGTISLLSFVILLIMFLGIAFLEYKKKSNSQSSD